MLFNQYNFIKINETFLLNHFNGYRFSTYDRISAVWFRNYEYKICFRLLCILQKPELKMLMFQNVHHAIQSYQKSSIFNLWNTVEFIIDIVYVYDTTYACIL